MLTGFRLKILRMHKKITQQYIADCIGVSRNYISMFENEKRKIPKDIYEKWILALQGKIEPSKNKK